MLVGTVVDTIIGSIEFEIRSRIRRGFNVKDWSCTVLWELVFYLEICNLYWAVLDAFPNASVESMVALCGAAVVSPEVSKYQFGDGTSSKAVVKLSSSLSYDDSSVV